MSDQLQKAIVLLRQENASLKMENQELQKIAVEVNNLSNSLILGWEELKVFLRLADEECRKATFSFDMLKDKLSEEDIKQLENNVRSLINGTADQLTSIVYLKMKEVEARDNIIKPENVDSKLILK